ncbi:MAG: glycosyltransferase family 2 protein [Bacteroidota bacterium]
MISIVIPYYNLAFFERTLQSLEEQTNKNFKIYIGNDASPDDPENLISKYRKCLNIKYQHFEKNLGQTSLVQQWERCLELTEDEDWIMILGDDDYLSKNYVAEFYRNLPEIMQHNIQVVRYASQVVHGEKVESKVFVNPKIEKSPDFFYRKFFGDARGTLSEQIFTRRSYLKYGFKNYPLGWGVDDIAWLEFSEFGKIFSINSATAFIRLSDKNISRKGYKTELKLQTKFTFLNYLVRNHLSNFKKKHRLPILLHYEIMGYEARKISLSLYFTVFAGLLSHLKFYEVLKFHRRFLMRYLSTKRRKII